MNGDWQMPRPGEACSACGHKFVPEEHFRTSLLPGSEGYQRVDVCERCPLPGDPAPVATWRTQRPAPKAPPATPLDRAGMLSLLRQLAEAERPEAHEFRFVLALLLWRKRVLQLDRSQQRGQQEVWRFTASGEDPVDVVRPELDEARLERLSEQLEQLIAGGIAPSPVLEPSP